MRYNDTTYPHAWGEWHASTFYVDYLIINPTTEQR